MVLASGLVAMQNPRSHIIAPPMRRPHDHQQQQQPEVEHRARSGGQLSNSRPLSLHSYISDGPGHKAREHAGQSFGRAFPGPTAGSASGSSQDVPRVEQMPHTLKSASTSSVVASRPDMVMVNGFIVHSKPSTVHRPARPNDLHQNGEMSVDSHSNDIFPRNSLKSASFTHFPTHALAQELPTLLDLTQHKAKAVYISPACPERLDYFDPRDSTDYGTLRPHSKGHSVRVTSANVNSLDYHSQEMISSSGGARSQQRTSDSQSNSMHQNMWDSSYSSTNYLLNGVDKVNSATLQRTRGQFDSKAHVSNSGAALGGMALSNGALVYKGLAPRGGADRERLDYGTRFSSMQCLHERTNTYKPNLKSVSSYTIRDDQQSPIAHHSGRASTGTNDYLQNCATMSSTLQRRGSDQLRRAVSYEQRGFEPAPHISRTSSDGEIESDYVTLDRRYFPFQSPRLSRVTEGVAPSSPPSLTDSNRAQNDTGTHAPNLDPINSDLVVHANINPIRTSKSMNTIRATNTPDGVSDPSQKRKINTGALRVVAETIGSVFHSPRSSGSSSRGSGSPRSVTSFGGAPMTFSAASMSDGGKSPRRMTRSKSLSDLSAPDGLTHYSDDEDGDDFGFLSYPISFTSPSSASAAMSKAKSPSPGNRIFPKRWRSKTKAVPTTATAATMWMPGPPGSCTWSSMSGRKVQLRPVSILSLTEAERLALQKIALLKLQAMDIGCPVAVPKENDELQRSKKSALSLKRRSKSVSAPALEAMGKDGNGQGLVFSIPLSKCIVNDKELDKRRKRIAAATGGSSSVRMKGDVNESLDSAANPVRKSSSSSQGSAENSNHLLSPHNDLSISSHKRAASSDSLSESESSRNTSSSLIDALSLSTSNPPSRLSSLAMDGSQLANQGQAQVPYVVKACFKHIETYGLQTLGIFRVGSSKKRVKQLREEFDSGKEVMLTDEYHPHDVAALLKEFFRDLPEPLLSRELYLPFLFAKRMKDEHKRHNALRLLISMLPVANRDTLWALLRFLATVSQHAADATDEKGEIIAGNKMDSHNLATLFGPNILHRTKATNDKDMMSESAERVEQSKEIIEVVKDLIDNHHDLFEISGSLRDDVLRLLIESNQEVVDTILKFLANQNQIEADPESMCSVFDDSMNSPVLYHAMNSDADLLNYARKQSLTSHRPLRVTKSADNSLDSPVSKSRATHLSESQAFSPTSKDNQASVPVISANLGKQRYDLSHGFPNPMVGILPILRVSQDITNPEVILRGRLDPGHAERPFSEGYNDSLNIPRPVYLRENSCSSVSSGLSSSLNSQVGSDMNQSGQWVLPTPPTSRGSSPKPSFKNSLSSTTLIAPSLSPVMQKHNFLKQDDENQPPLESSEWERWRQWEKIAAEKKNSETEQETLV